MKIVSFLKSSDGMSSKYIQETLDNHRIETLYVDYPNKHIICYSTQIGCTGNCRFCYTGIEGKFIRNLTDGEIVNQCTNVIDMIKCSGYNDMMDIHGREVSNKKPILFSAMGIGDPLCNLQDYITSVKIIQNKYPTAKFALATRVPKYNSLNILAKFYADLHIKVMISLHSVDDSIRYKLIPTSVDVDTVLSQGLYYEETTGNKVEYNITLIDRMNDSNKDANAVASKLKSVYNQSKLKPKIKINKYNMVSNSIFKPSKRVERFIDILKLHDIDVEYYETNGSDINGACGQMVSI